MEQTKKNRRIKQWCLGSVGLLILGAAIFALWPKPEHDKRDEIIEAALRVHPTLSQHHGPISLTINPDGTEGVVAWTEAEDSGRKEWQCRFDVKRYRQRQDDKKYPREHRVPGRLGAKIVHVPLLKPLAVVPEIQRGEVGEAQAAEVSLQRAVPQMQSPGDTELIDAPLVVILTLPVSEPRSDPVEGEKGADETRNKNLPEQRAASGIGIGSGRDVC